MRFHRNFWIAAAVFLFGLVLSGCGLSLAGDVTPPPNYRAPAQLPTNPATAGNQPAMGGQAAAGNQPASSGAPVFPLVPPDPSQGKAIYVQKCLPCHGEQGLGDGPQSANLPNPAAPIGSAEWARSARPVDWFNTVTAGKLDKYMPGFSGSLDDRQRWDVVAYALSLSMPSADLEKGKAVYTQNCAACHGESGQGDGAQAASLSTKPPAWASDPKLLAQLSEEDMVSAITGGMAGHPSFADKLDNSQRYQVVQYVRSLSFASASQLAQSAVGETITPAAGAAAAGATPEAAVTSSGTAVAAAPQKITVDGQVSSGTPGSKLPAGMKVTLQGYSGMTKSFDLTSDVAADGSYHFENVDLNPDYVYIAQVDANGLTFNSDILHATDVKDGKASLPIQIYETATDPSVLKVDRMHVFFDFSKPGIVQVVNLFVISNPTDKVVIAEPRDKPVIQFDVPKGATNLQFQDGQIGDGRYVQTPNGFGDTQAVIPGTGQYQVLFAYDMPYENKLDVAFKAPLPVEAAIVMVPPGGVTLKSSQLTDAGQRDVQGMSFHMYQSVNSLKTGDTLAVSLSGSSSAGSTGGSDSLTYLLIGIGAFGVVLVGAGLWLYRRRTQLEPALEGAGEDVEQALEEPAETSDAILDAILALDDLHGSGKLPDAAYQERRSALKARLAEAMGREKSS